MANMTIFIDETGTFSQKSKVSYIGGWICKTESVINLKKIINNSIRHFNDYLKSEEIQSFVLNYSSHMHFMPLHIRDLRVGKDSGITIHPRHTPVFFKHLFKSLNDLSVQVFRSTGKPVITPNEQAVYIEILRNTLLQIIDQSVKTSQNLTLNIVIAHRRMPSLYGEEGIEDTAAYEKHMIEGLSKELLGAFESNKPKIHISFADARYTPGLIIADFFCGAQRWKENNYLEQYQQIESYPFASGYKRIGSRMVQRLKYFQDIDAPSAAILCADILSSDPQNEEMSLLLTSMLKKMSHKDKSLFCKNINELFDDKLVSDPERYSHLETMNQLIIILRSIFSTNYDEMSQNELQLIAVLFLNKIRIDSHLGKTSSKDINQYLSFLDDYGDRTFFDQMKIMQQRIDATLIGVQVSAFNTFKFDDIENTLKNVKNQYYKMFNFQPEINTVKDNNLARLEGTLGQMYGFQCDIEQDNDYFELAEDCLKMDISACIDNAASWEQANGYLTSLYWKNEQLDKAVEQFIKESKLSINNSKGIYDLNDSALSTIKEKPFIQLHRLYLCALAAKSGTEIKGLNTEKEFLLTKCDTTSYPLMLSAKWLAIIYLLNEDYINAIEILDASLINEQNEATIDVIALPIQILHHFTLIKLKRKSNFNCEEQVKKLGHQQKEIKEGLIKLGIEKYYTNEENWSVYDIGTLLPFYFS